MINKAPNEVATAADPSIVVQISPNSTLGQAAFGTAAVLGGTSSAGSQVETAPGNWSVNHTPAAATQATISKAAVAATRHVCTSIAATLATAATAQAAAAIVTLRDGASGAGTIIWSKQVILPVNGVWEIDLAPLNIVGSVNTAMTLEFTAAGVAGSFESVSMTGYDAS